MRKLSFLAAGLIFLIACNNRSEENAGSAMLPSDLISENLRGDIASYEQIPYKTDSTGKIGEMDSCCISVTEYNENGNATKNISKDSKGTITEETTFERHPNGLWKGATTVKDGKTTQTFNTQVDDKGNYTVATQFDSTGKMENYYTDITQNDYGMVLSWKQYDKDSVFRQEGESKYDKFMQTSFTLKDSLGNVKSTSAYKYNDKGEQTEMSNTNITKDSTTTKVTKYTYDDHDDKGNWIQRTTWNDKGNATKIEKRTYTYRKSE